MHEVFGASSGLCSLCEVYKVLLLHGGGFASEGDVPSARRAGAE